MASSYTKTNKVTHAGVEVSNWSGDWECSVCKRKRMIAAEFSKKMQEKRHKDPTANLKCKKCVDAVQAAEQSSSAKKNSDEEYLCARCNQTLNGKHFTSAQIKKGPGKQRCSQCIAKDTQDEAKAAEDRKSQALEEAKKAVKAAEASGSVAEQLKASAKLAALEGELVTGIRPKGGAGRGRRGRGSGRASGRGRGL